MVPSLWTGAGAADLTKVYGPGYTQADQTATGKYTLYFQDVGSQVIDCQIHVHQATGEDPLIGSFVPGTFSIANKTLNIEISDLAGTLTDAPSATKVSIFTYFSKNPT